MPDLGIYAFAVLASYAVTLVLLAGLIGLSLRQWRVVKAVLEKVEQDGQD